MTLNHILMRLEVRIIISSRKNLVILIRKHEHAKHKANV